MLFFILWILMLLLYAVDRHNLLKFKFNSILLSLVSKTILIKNAFIGYNSLRWGGGQKFFFALYEINAPPPLRLIYVNRSWKWSCVIKYKCMVVCNEENYYNLVEDTNYRRCTCWYSSKPWRRCTCWYSSKPW